MHKNMEEALSFLEKGAEEIIGWEELVEKLIAGKALKVKLGLDPSAPDIHLGHTVVLRKLKAFQDLGHEVHIIIGDFTGRIGDPSGKSTARVELSREKVLENAKTYTDQIFRILDEKKTTVHFNSTWLEKINLEEMLHLMKTTTVARMLEREDFKNRFLEHQPISLHEFLYPLLQGFDSIAMEADVELGGRDQTFNLLMGRTLQKARGLTPQTVMMMPLLEGLDGVQKMSKSLGNYVGIHDAPEIMFQKLMTLPDPLILKYFTLVTDARTEELQELKKRLDQENPREVKLTLATLVTAMYHDEALAHEAKEAFLNLFTHKEVPKDLPILKLQEVSSLPTLLKEAGFLPSQNEFKRLLHQRGVAINGEKITVMEEVPAEGSFLLTLGKRNHLRVVLEENLK